MLIKTRKVDIELNGEIVKKDFEVPEDWSDRAATIMATKYATDTENSAMQIIDRVVNQITAWGLQQKYFNEEVKTIYHLDGTVEKTESQKFAIALTDILVNQRAAFNSPVWFNIGVKEHRPQASACFIIPVEDTMEDILAHNTREGLIFRSGSGSGTNVSKLRAKGEKLSNKGASSGPISFMRTWDVSAGSIKSGGKNRRSAKMVCMDVDHPDIEEFVTCKKTEEDKARILVAGGVELEEAKSTICFQNTNHSIRVTNEFMDAAKHNDIYDLVNRGNKEVAKKINALDLLKKASEMAWHCGDPGIQYDDRMNKDNPVPSMDKIRSTNPCSEFSAIDNSSCNLASLNLVKYARINGNSSWNSELFRKDIHTLVTAMDILIEPAYYPTPEVRAVTLATRPLGLGFTNLGALLMQWGLAYDSGTGRRCAADITKRMTEAAYEQSVKLAQKLGSYPAFANNVRAAINIADRITTTGIGMDISNKGLRNSQLTLLAPTGTISFMMDCETTGIEPFLFEESTKKCVDGSTMKISSPSIEMAKKKYKDCVPDLYKTAYGENSLSWKAHLDMMAACQPYLNGAISKTVALPNSATPEDIFNCYVYGWNVGLKAIAVYRDGSKIDQPVNNAKQEPKVTSFVMPSKELVADIIDKEEPKWTAVRRKLDDTRYGPNHKFDIGGFEGYVLAGTYPEGDLGEIFIIASKSGSTMQGVLDGFATAVSIGLQYGVPLEKYVEKFTGTKFEPAGFTRNPDIRICSSVIDYIFRWLGNEFLEDPKDNEEVERPHTVQKEFTFDGPNCQSCGGITQRAGSCFVCTNCGNTSGCS
jgi:ribonucleoside-diphosphate reductase alpha chain